MLFYVVKDALLPCKSCSFTSENMPFYIGKHALFLCCLYSSYPGMQCWSLCNALYNNV